jgi:hypothetical protein
MHNDGYFSYFCAHNIDNVILENAQYTNSN